MDLGAGGLQGRHSPTASRSKAAIAAWPITDQTKKGGVWKPALVFHLLVGKLPFNALCRITPSATPRMINLHPRELEANGIVNRTVYPRPRRRWSAS